MNRQPEVIGGKAKFFRAGVAFTVPTAGTASKTAAPGAADTAWTPLGAVEITLKPTINEKEIKDITTTGHRVRTDIIQYGRMLDIPVKCKEMSNLIFEAILGADAMPDSSDEGDETPTAGGTFVPMENHEGIKGWLSVDYLGRGGQLLNTTVWVDFKANEDFAPGEEPVEYEMLARVLYSTANTGALA